MLLFLFAVEASFSRRIANALKPSQPPKKFLHVKLYSSKDKVAIEIEGKNVCSMYICVHVCVCPHRGDMCELLLLNLQRFH